MQIVDKYILRQLVVGFTLILVSLTILIWLTQSLKMIDMIVTKGVSVGIFLEMTILVLPNFLQILMPLALFAVTLFTFIRMQSDKELMVLKAVGMSGKQLMKPVLMMAGVLTVVGYILSFVINFGLGCSMAAIVITRKKERENFRDLISSFKKVIYPAMAGILSSLAYLLILLAMLKTTQLSFLQAFRQMSLPIGLMLGIIILKEPAYRPKRAGCAMIVTGLVVIAFLG